jgi:uncharacterized protein YndB with AHSA1/START domain
MAHPGRSVIEQSVEINAPAATVWRVFTDPVLTRHMGGEYVSTWTTGASLRSKGLDGQLYTDGVILNIEPEKLLEHKLLRPNVSSIASVITYQFHEQDGRTTLLAREEFSSPITESEYGDAVEGWEGALGSVKQIAEKQ